MKHISNLFIASLALFLLVAEPALAQSIDLSPIQSLLQGIVDALTGPLGVVIATSPCWASSSVGSSTSSICARRFGFLLASLVSLPPPPLLPRSSPVAERSPLFLGLVRPPKLLGLPIMYAMVWLFGSVLLFVWVQNRDQPANFETQPFCDGRANLILIECFAFDLAALDDITGECASHRLVAKIKAKTFHASQELSLTVANRSKL